MGGIDVINLDGDIDNYPMALLIEFDNAEDIRQAIKNGSVEFEFSAA